MYLTVQVAGEQITAYFGDKDRVGVTLTGEHSVTFSKADIELLFYEGLFAEGGDFDRNRKSLEILWDVAAVRPASWRYCGQSPA